MKKLLKSVAAGTGLTFQNKPIFSPSDIIEILGQIEELQKCNVGLAPDKDGNLLLLVGDNQNELTDKAAMVFV